MTYGIGHSRQNWQSVDLFDHFIPIFVDSGVQAQTALRCNQNNICEVGGNYETIDDYPFYTNKLQVERGIFCF